MLPSVLESMQTQPAQPPSGRIAHHPKNAKNLLFFFDVAGLDLVMGYDTMVWSSRQFFWAYGQFLGVGKELLFEFYNKLYL
jgi:hypothetical protein